MTFRETIFPTWTRLTTVSRRARRRNSDRGRLMQTGTIVCGAVGLDTDLSFVYQLFALMLCIVVFARVSLRFQHPEVTVRRHLPRYATAGEPFEYTITVVNQGNRVERDLKIVDNPKVVSPDLEQFMRMREPNEETRNAYDRWIGFHRFIWLQRYNTGINVQNAEVPDIELQNSANAVVSATPIRRGAVYFESITVLFPDPFGLNYGIVSFDDRERLTVLPRRYPVSRRFEFRGGRHFQPGGVNSTWSIGESDEFVSLREYRDGDPIRKIHWASSAKRDKPVVKEYQDEFFVRQGLVIDCSDPGPTLFEDVITVAASLLTSLENLDGLMDLCFHSNHPQVITAGRGYAQTSQQLEALATLEPSSGEVDDFTEMLSERARLLSGCLFVFSAFGETQKQQLAAVESKGVQTAVFIVVDEDNECSELREDFHVLKYGDIEAGLGNL